MLGLRLLILTEQRVGLDQQGARRIGAFLGDVADDLIDLGRIVGGVLRVPLRQQHACLALLADIFRSFHLADLPILFEGIVQFASAKSV